MATYVLARGTEFVAQTMDQAQAERWVEAEGAIPRTATEVIVGSRSRREYRFVAFTDDGPDYEWVEVR